MNVRFRNPYKNQADDETMVAPEGIYSGQSLYFGKKAKPAVGNCLPIGKMTEGTICCNVERYPGDRGKLAKVGGEYISIVGHNEDAGITKIRLPSGAKKNLINTCRGVVGIVSGGGRTEKPVLKAGRNCHKFRAKRNEWPKVRGVCMNPVDHPHGGGNHQHLGTSSTVSRFAPPGRKVGLIAARRTGRVRGRPSAKGENE
jgi:large subunit ribosomal protein L8e